MPAMMKQQPMLYPNQAQQQQGVPVQKPVPGMAMPMQPQARPTGPGGRVGAAVVKTQGGAAYPPGKTPNTAVVPAQPPKAFEDMTLINSFTNQEIKVSGGDLCGRKR